jgi:hypothetical protein
MISWRDFLTTLFFVLLIVECSSATEPLKKESAQQKAVSGHVRAACDEAEAIAANTPGVTVRKHTGKFHDQALREPVFGCGLWILGSFAAARGTGDAAVRIREGFSAQGWEEMPAYGADGKDGTSFAFRKAGVACLVRGEWDGGADGEPEIPPKDWYKVSVLCTSPAFPDDR